MKWEKVIQKGMVYPLDELAQEYDACFMQVVDPDVASWYTSKDGHIYQYPNSAYTLSDYEQYDTIASDESFSGKKGYIRGDRLTGYDNTAGIS